jgi:hypothetical protein
VVEVVAKVLAKVPAEVLAEVVAKVLAEVLAEVLAKGLPDGSGGADSASGGCWFLCTFRGCRVPLKIDLPVPSKTDPPGRLFLVPSGPLGGTGGKVDEAQKGVRGRTHRREDSRDV